MSWEESYRKGSFRGVPFVTKDDLLRGGRRGVVHEYPMRNLPYPQDIGKKARRYQLNAILVGDDYMMQRDALIGALETPGPGILVHPYYGQVEVALDGEYTISQTTENGGMCRVTATFVDAGANVFPAAVADTAAAMKAAANAVDVAAAEQFAKAISVAGLPEVVKKNLIDDLMDKADTWLDKVAGAIPTIPQQVYDVLAKARTLSAKLAGLIHKPLDLAREVQAIWKSVTGIFDLPADAVKAYGRLFRQRADERNTSANLGRSNSGAFVQSSSVSLMSKTASALATNALAVEQLETLAMISNAAKSISLSQFDNAADAAVATYLLTEEIEAAMLVADDNTFIALRDLRVTLKADMDQRSVDLPRINSIILPESTPTLVALHQLFGKVSPAAEADFIARNKLRHPGFVTGGLPLEVRVAA